MAYELARHLAGRGEVPAARRLLTEASRSPALAETPEFAELIRTELARLSEV